MPVGAAPLWRPLGGLAYNDHQGVGLGDLVRVPLGKESVPACIVSTDTQERKGLKEVGEVIAPRLFPSSLIELCSHVADQQLSFLGEVLGLALPRDIMRPPKRPGTRVDESGMRRHLRMRSDEEGLLVSVRRSRNSILLHSAADYTGLMVELVRQALDAGKQVLLLFPNEPGMARLYERFQPYLPLRLYHSGLGQSERRQIWHGIRQGSLSCVGGMRSAVLLPFVNPGLFLVFDEDSASYRVRSHHIHYNARDLALFRAGTEGFKTILLSISPSLEIAHSARSGKLTRIERRAGQKGKALVVDMGTQAQDSVLSQPLIKQLNLARESGMKALLLLNRLGMAARLMCLDCGNVLVCEGCGMPLKLIGPGAPLECRFCRKEVVAPEQCPVCKGVRWMSLSPGLGKLKKELLGIFSPDQICEVKGEHRPIIADAARSRLLFGTSAVLEYLPPKVRVAAMLSWDAERSHADFRSPERAFRAIAYLRRILVSTPQSRLVVQTFRPNDKLLEWALKGDYETFFKSEVRRRRELGYPPYRRLLLFEEGTGRSWDAEKLLGLLDRDGAQTLGPYDGKEGKASILVKLRRDIPPRDLIDSDRLRRSGWRVEVDPVEIL
ncbi:hypothetical protein JXM67_09480 [candidate division WOR-3 bacterium]|nr:hypothetical protein [candidate division WOR-3 bacterium]